MNRYKLGAILDFIRRQGKLPTDQWGEVLCPDDLLVWYGLNGRLNLGEEIILKEELALMAEAEAFMDRLRCQKA